jgi:hypothetical protein
MATTVYVVKKLGVMCVANFGAIIGMIYGIIMGFILAINVGSSAAIAGGPMVLGVGSGIMTFCINVILMTIFGFIGGAIAAFIYNFALGGMGGIEVNLEIKQ